MSRRQIEVASGGARPAGGARNDRGAKAAARLHGGLDEEHRRVLLLAYYNGWSREQLAAKFDKPVNTIKTWLRRGLIQIRECLGA